MSPLRPLLQRARELRDRTAPAKRPNEIHRVLLFSLARQAVRRRQFLEQLQRFPELLSRVEWVKAIDGASLDLAEVPEDIVEPQGIEDAQRARTKVLGFVLTKGAIGLAWTWFDTLDAVLRDQDPSHVYLICEDDARFCPNFVDDFHELRLRAERHDPLWEVLHIGYHVVWPPGRKLTCGHDRCNASCALGRPTVIFGAYAVALRPLGAALLYERIFPVSLQVDSELSRVYQHLAKSSGPLEARVRSQQKAQGPAVRVFAPRSVSEAEVSRFPRCTGPLVLAPPSQAGSTDIQVLSSENWALQYGDRAVAKKER
ncbi:unnamed protein product [Durusdinium trenchii]|uniref:Uncharacterized protein n=1 Tax=Durusdinium trenchii TaxID=1381693 RepID=A0ABP0H9G6_9DINO